MRTTIPNQPKAISTLIWVLIVFTLVALPLRIISFGFLPPDDALRHAAKAVNGKPWSEILVLRPEVTIDHNPGWHVLLTVVHRATGWDPKQLVYFSIVSMFLLLSVTPPFFFRRQEAWIASFALIMCAFTYFAGRSMIGRPLFVSMTATISLLALWTRPSSNPAPKLILCTIILVALSAWIHGSWYLLVLVPAAFFLARQWRKGTLLFGCWVAGTILGALLTGKPWTFLHESALIPFMSVRPGTNINVLVGELKPIPPANAIVPGIAFALALVWRKHVDKSLRPVLSDPIYLLGLLCLILSFRVVRFWLDWGIPALILFLAREFESILFRLKEREWTGLFVTAASCVALFAFYGTDRRAQWSSFQFQALDARNPRQAEWLPAPGGILYSVDLSVFYQTFFANPHGQWKYALGFEPSFMTSENLAIYDELCRTLNATTALVPWVKRMTPKDRLVLLGPPTITPAIKPLEWNYVLENTWVGRIPQAQR